MRKKLRIIPVFICILAVIFTGPDITQAGTWNNAKTFYNNYGNSVVFKSTSSTDGLIYFATRGSTATTTTKYRTIGWKMTIKNSSGKTLQTLYYKLGGSYMTSTDCQVNSDYTYDLYSLSLYNVKRRLNTKACAAMNNADMEIVLDACMVVSKNNKVQGAMNDSGPTSGKVYTTYSGISGAASWGPSSKSALKSYFNKKVDGLFVDVSVSYDSGISGVTGSGTYFYGTYVTLTAKVKKGYDFDLWSGSMRSTKENVSFYATSDCFFSAGTTKKKVEIVFHRNFSETDSTSTGMTIAYGSEAKTLKKCRWKKDGNSIIGWAKTANSSKVVYSTGYTVTDSFILKYSPCIDLYAVYPEKIPDTPETETGGDDTTPETPTPDKPTPPTPSAPTPETPPTPDTETPDTETPTPETPTPDTETPTPDTETPGTPTPDTETPDAGDSDKVATGIKKIRIRFISSKYFEDESNNLISQSRGGLAADSKWATDSDLRALLRRVLNC